MMPGSGYFVTALLAASAALAAPQLTELRPRGAQRGKAFTLTLVGKDLPEGAQIVSGIPGTLTPLTPSQEPRLAGKQLPYLVELKEDAAVGLYPVRVQTADGLSNILLFTVGAFPEAGEAEAEPDSREHSNDSIETAQTVIAPVIVNGTLRGPDRDYYRLRARKGEHFVFEVEGRRAGSAVDPVIRVIDSAGRPLGRSEDAPGIGVDARMDLTFPHDGDYYAIVQDARLSEQLQNFYRLKIANYDYAEGLFPLGGKRGEKVEVELFGGNLRAPVKTSVDLSSVPKNAAFTSVSLPGTPGALPFVFAVGDLPETLEQNTSYVLPPATVVNGRIGQPNEVDRYKLAVTPGEEWSFELRCRGLGTSRLDGVLSVWDEKGKKVASAGDVPPKEDVFSLLSAGRTATDPWLAVKVPDDVHALTVAVEDLVKRGGPGFGYRLQAEKQHRDFTLSLASPYVNIPANGTVVVTVAANRRGYLGPIQLTIPDLGPDYEVQGGYIPAEQEELTSIFAASRRGVITITAKPTAKPKPMELAVWGEGTTADGTTMRRRATGPGMVTEIAGGTGISDAEGRERYTPFVAPWLGLDLPAMVSREQPGTIESSAPKTIRLVQGTGFELKWAYNSKVPDMRPPENIDVDMPGAREFQVRKAEMERKSDKYAEKGTLLLLTTTQTPAQKFNLVLAGELSSGMGEDTIYSPALTVEVLQGYRMEPPKTATVQPGGRVELSGRLIREPEFQQPVIVKLDNAPAGMKCASSDAPANATEYRIVCEAGTTVKPGEYPIQLSSSSSVIGLDKRQTSYSIAPVEGKLVVSAAPATTATR
jgi:hypothetical protein